MLDDIDLAVLSIGDNEVGDDDMAAGHTAEAHKPTPIPETPKRGLYQQPEEQNGSRSKVCDCPCKKKKRRKGILRKRKPRGLAMGELVLTSERVPDLVLPDDAS